MKEPLSLGVQRYMELARAHWKEHRPKMYRELKAKGQLEQALQRAAENTLEAKYQIIDHLREVNTPPQDFEERVKFENMIAHQAWELVREEWIFLPSEEDVPNLGQNT